MATQARLVDVPKVEYLGNGQYGRSYLEPTQPGDDLRRDVTWWVPTGVSSPGSSGMDAHGTDLFQLFDPTRVLVDCQIKRQLLELHDPRITKLLLKSYVDHPDWRAEWSESPFID